MSFQDVSEVSIGPFFGRKIPKAYSKSRLLYTLKVSRDVSYPKKECQIDNWPSSIGLFFDSVQEWTFLDPDWLVAIWHIILYPFMILRSRPNLMDSAPLFFPYFPSSFVSCGEFIHNKTPP